jgi:hypothetical protein
MHLLALLLLAAPTATPAPASAPAAPAAAPAPAAPDVLPLKQGTVSVSFFVPGDSKLVGAAFFLANDVALRLDGGIDAALTPGGAGRNVYFSLAAGVRFYQLKHERVALFFQPSAAFGREASPAVGAEPAEFLRLGVGLGVEYFFTNHFSVGAILELTFKIADIAGPAGNPIYTSLNTDTSALSANYFF